MGVKLLNTFLKERYPSVIQSIHWGTYKGEKIAIDTNNYMYAFMSEDRLIQGFVHMCDTFKYFGIIPLFVFDGKPPPEKIEEIKERKKIRKETKKKYINIKKNLSTKQKIEMKRKMVKVTENETTKVQELLKLYGFSYINAPCEGDVLCSKLVMCKKVYACMSEDMDLFVYGCARILRNYSHTNYVLAYDLNEIVNSMNVNFYEFKYLSFLGNLKKLEKKYNIFYFYDTYKNFNTLCDFNCYLLINNTITNKQLEEIQHKMLVYDLHNSDILSKCSYILIKNKKFNKYLINKIKRNWRQPHCYLT